MSTLKVDAIRHNSATSDAITTASDGTCTAKLTSIGGGGLSHRNIIINGAMSVAQRATTSTTSGYASIDRWNLSYGGTDEAITQSKINVAPTEAGAGTAGFRNAFRIQNGNQTSGFGNTDYFQFQQMIEDQNIANSGWIVNDPNSFITVSYWIRSSVAQQFFGFVETYDGADWMYGWSTGVLTANVWTKITKTVPGRSNLSWSNDTGAGLLVAPVTLWGTNYTDSSVPNDAWHQYFSSSRTPDATSTWWTTNDATVDITGVQVEVGDTATSFEHRSYGEELTRCKRYYQTVPNNLFLIRGSDSISYSNAPLQSAFLLPESMRANPTGSNYTDGGSLITVTYYNASYGSATNYEANITNNIHNGTVRFHLGHNQANNSSTSLSTSYKWGQSVDPIEFSAEL